jgi:hypothetical protein
MKRTFVVCSLVVGIVLLTALTLLAEVKTEEKTQVKFEGMMGRMMGMFGGKAAREGTINTVAVKGNRKMTANELSGEIVDLDEQKVYQLDMKKKTYEAMTFEEIRRRMKEAQEKAANAMKEQKEQKEQPEQKPSGEKQMQIDFSLQESGQTRTINGFDCRESVMTVTAHEKDKTIEQSGGMVMTSHIWMAPAIPAAKEIVEFDMRYWKALMGGDFMAGAQEQMTAAMAMYPAMKDMLGKVQVESGRMNGTAILTESTMETVRSPEQAAEAKKQEPAESSSGGVTSIRGIGGMLGRRMARKKEEPSAAAASQQNKAVLFTSIHELLKVSTSVASSDLAIPAGFKEKK